MNHPEDIIVWPCGTWCCRENLEEYTHMSDDFKVISYNDDEWDTFAKPVGL